MISELSDIRRQQVIAFSWGFGIICAIISPLAGGFAYFAFALKWWFAISLLGWLAGGLVIALQWLAAIHDMRWFAVEYVADYLDTQQSQRDALARSQIGQLNINQGGTQKVTNKPVTYRVNGKVVSGNEITHREEVTNVLTLSDADTFFMLEWFAKRGLSRNAILGQELPYSRQPVRRALYEPIVAALIEGNEVINRRRGYEGDLVDSNPRNLMKVVKAKYPDGVPIQDAT